MQINDPDSYVEAEEADIIERLLKLEGRRILELGCGAAWMTRLLAERFAPATIVATEVDRTQLEKNLASDPIPRVTFRYGGAEDIDDPDHSYDVVFMFKSLHHVPTHLMDRALREVQRVLVPGGQAYFSEPVYWGDFNDLMRLIHDEKRVREAAFAAIEGAVASGLFETEVEVFFDVPGTYESWEQFEDRFLKVTHTELAIGPAKYERIKRAFLRHMSPSGAHFLKPHRVNLLRKPL